MSDRTFLLPDLGEGLTEAEVVRWLVAEGDTVAVDQPVVEVETAKSLVEVPTPYAGRIATRHAPEGATLEVGKPLLTVAALVPAAETYREEEQAGSGNVLIGYGTTGASATSRRRRPRVAVQPAAPAAGRAPLVISPLVRRLAREGGLDLRSVTPSGPGGIITRADVDRALTRPSASPQAAESGSTGSWAPTQADDSAAAAPAPPAQAADLRSTASVASAQAAGLGSTAFAAPAQAAGSAAGAPAVAGERRIALSGFRKAVSAALTRSRAEIPEATVWVDVDATPLWELRASTPGGPGLLAYIARFVVAGLRQYPMLNARVDTERQEIVEFERVNLGIAVQGERGLVVPAVMDAGNRTTAQLDEEIRRVTASAREGRATAQELSAGTFTLNNYGSFNVDGSAAIINHPQVAILGFGRIIDRPWVVGGELCVRKITQMSFVFDHRVCDGGTAAGFMRSVADAIEDPASAIARL